MALDYQQIKRERLRLWRIIDARLSQGYDIGDSYDLACLAETALSVLESIESDLECDALSDKRAQFLQGQPSQEPEKIAAKEGDQ